MSRYPKPTAPRRRSGTATTARTRPGRTRPARGSWCTATSANAYNLGTANGTKVLIWECNGQNNQKWNINSDGTITNVNAGLCLYACNAMTNNGTCCGPATAGPASS
ncbi:ricin-type beta-trefoil lectin domain protein [Streptomyces sp. OV198]|uniref:ricin-type beta-trefoil lectin domain protein n=1 Tax=Streptomyces sp. OV198 TaxID=1882787 RepID=UPI00359C3669